MCNIIIWIACLSKGWVDEKKLWRLVTLKCTSPIPFAATGMRYCGGEKKISVQDERMYHWLYGRRLFGVVVFLFFLFWIFLLVIFRILSDRQIYASDIKKFDRLRREKNPFFTKDSPYLRHIYNSIAGAKLNEPSRIFFDSSGKKFFLTISLSNNWHRYLRTRKCNNKFHILLF